MKKLRLPKVRIYYTDAYRFMGGVSRRTGKRKVVQVGLTQYGSIRHAVVDLLWSRPLAKWNGHRQMQQIALGGCERCGTFWRLGMVSSMTCYHWDGKGEDPNRDRRLCPDCTDYHIDYWEGMWRDYYGGRL
ncbi:hypothetical protein CcrKarma_gp132 [Caulobacter virus Karma]|uniref:Uncharacterized protein n=1 Tax=Caulobacter phage CcrSwift TaxID=2927984 RepID=K4JVM2_9CAUD|nr:hypothetical protein CcrKarma_gp132 [Caulobacter virus Karma]YP_006989860.1 hypothetical protein D870_gp294 [Caulobacter phage CcrSwift]AFU87649.1 hypothetical protein CcrKarma_gp132 [Caulobacter virus Karma]AFU88445.1 hypothetical protein CcrSwift_gp127 [Caulobacter phage CcrSwift]ARB14345.1 hypothetical protein Ccr5_gp126c [Caulobacter phage Ccr5]